MRAMRWTASWSPSTGRCAWPRAYGACSTRSTWRCFSPPWPRRCGFGTRAPVGAGAIAVIVAFALRILGMSQWIMWEISQLFENIGTVHDGINSISLPPTVDDAPGAPALPRVQGDVRFEDVSFHYGQGSGVIEGLSLHIRPGEKIGVVGRSGAGKSTLVNLLLRFHDVEGGRILVDRSEER